MPYRREPITIPMVLLLAKWTVHTGPNSFVPAFCNWVVLSLHCGFYYSKWTVPVSSHSANPLASDRLLMAFTFNNMHFYCF